MDMDFVGVFELEYAMMVDFSRIIMQINIIKSASLCAYHLLVTDNPYLGRILNDTLN